MNIGSCWSIEAQKRDLGRTQQDLAKVMHPSGRLLVRSDPGLAKLIELIETRQLDLKL
jgi:hypothetical protein